MFDSPYNPQTPLQESLRSFRAVLLVGSISLAVVFVFGMFFHP